MPISFEDVKNLKDDLDIEYQARHADHRKLRKLWSGKGWWDDTDTSKGLSQLYRDLRGRKPGAPDIRVVNNVLKQVCDKYQAFLSPLPMITVPVDGEYSTRKKNQATRKERYLYGSWNQRPLSMSMLLNKAAWYLPLMGDCFVGAYPDLENNLIRPMIRSPEYAYPSMSWDGVTLDSVIFSWGVRESQLKAQFPKYIPSSSRAKSRTFLGMPMGGKLPRSADPEVELVEYSDKNEITLWADGVGLRGVEHEAGFNLYDQVGFINVPDEPWNHGAVEQAVSMVEAGNVLHSLLMQAVFENVFPDLVLVNPSKAPEEIVTGGGGVIPINEGGNAFYLQAPSQALVANTQFMQENERAIKQDTSMPDVNFGQFKASIITGKAINELQGAGTGSLVEMVQGNGIGVGMVSWNEKAILLAQRMLREDTINVTGFETGNSFEIHPRHFHLQVKGKQLIGSSRNEVIFSPHIAKHDKLVMMLQALGAGLVSKQYAREQIGISDTESMDEAIVSEAIQDMTLQAIAAALQQAPGDTEVAGDTEAKALAYIHGGPIQVPAMLQGGGTPPGVPGAVLGAGPPGAAPPPSFGGGEAGATPALPGAPPGGEEGMQEPLQEPQTQNEVTLEQAVPQFQAAQGLQGRVFLVGEIVDQGRTDDPIEVFVNISTDRDIIKEQVQFDLMFQVGPGEPNEEFIEVTPGAVPEQAGQAPSFEGGGEF